MSTTTSTVAPANPRDAVPEGGTERYGSGWSYANWWISKGGGLMADPCDNWHNEKANGFCDRLKLERDARQEPVLA